VVINYAAGKSGNRTEIKRRQKLKNTLKTILDGYLPKRLISCLLPDELLNISLQDLSDRRFSRFQISYTSGQLNPTALKVIVLLK